MNTPPLGDTEKKWLDRIFKDQSVAAFEHILKKDLPGIPIDPIVIYEITGDNRGEYPGIMDVGVDAERAMIMIKTKGGVDWQRIDFSVSASTSHQMVINSIKLLAFSIKREKS